MKGAETERVSTPFIFPFGNYGERTQIARHADIVRIARRHAPTSSLQWPTYFGIPVISPFPSRIFCVFRLLFSEYIVVFL